VNFISEQFLKRKRGGAAIHEIVVSQALIIILPIALAISIIADVLLFFLWRAKTKAAQGAAAAKAGSAPPEPGQAELSQAAPPPPAADDSTVVCLMVIDNYYDALEATEDLLFPMLTALVDRKLSMFAQQAEGIIKKYEQDKYILLFAKDRLETLKKNKFDILEQVKTIEFGNKMHVTLSVGIGLGGRTLAKTQDYARAAVNLALGRGGDQAIIKEGDKYAFYGALALESAADRRSRARVKLFALKELINEASNVLIMGHANPDADCVAASVGLHVIADALGKPSNIVLESYGGMVKALYENLVNTRDYGRGVFIGRDDAVSRANDRTLLIVADTYRPSLLECRELLGLVKKTVVIDHHRMSAEYIENTVLTYHEPYASSTSELVTQMLQHMEGLKLKNAEADALLAGITVDTKGFTFKTGSRTFEAASYLRRNGADGLRVRLLLQDDIESYRARIECMLDAKFIGEHIALAQCPPNAPTPSLTAAQAADELLTIAGVQVSFVLSQIGDVVCISARSLGGVNVQVLMEELGGGGHLTIASAQIAGKTMEEVRNMLRGLLREHNLIKNDIDGVGI